MTRELVFSFTGVTWDGSAGRGMNFCQDRFLQGLLRREDVNVLVANPYRSAPRRIARRILGREVPFPASERAALWDPLRLRRQDPTSLRALERAYRRYGMALGRAAARAGFERPPIVTFNPMVAGMADLSWAGPVTLYATDDFAAHHGYSRWEAGYREAYARVRDSRHAVCAVSEEIIDRISPTGPCAVVPNGIDPAEWDEIGAPPRWVEELPRPLLLYVGTLDSRVDVELVAETARAVAGGTVALVGRLADPQHIQPLRSLPNVVIQAPVSRAEIPGLTQAADACLVPHQRTPLTRAMSPLKVYEYLAGGRPVASVDLAPIRGIHDQVVLVSERESFADGVAEALRLGPLSEADRETFVRENSWEQRHEVALSLALRLGTAAPVR